jgi:hypothetical protein
VFREDPGINGGTKIEIFTHIARTTTMDTQTLPEMLAHPLQRLRSPSRTLSLALHTIGICSFAKSFEYLETHPNRINQSYGWHVQYLTILGNLVSLHKT